MNLLVKFPTRSRPDKFLEVLGKYTSMSTTGKVRYLITLDVDDELTNTQEVIGKAKSMGDVTVAVGVSQGKIHACNRDMEQAGDWDVLVLASDDMVPVKAGWDAYVTAAFGIYFPDTDGVVHFSDGHTPLNTQCILGRKYFDRFGYIYHPAYRSLWCDNEFQQVSWTLDKSVFINETIIEHQHYTNGYGQPDALMRYTERLYDLDRRTYEKRRAMNFGLK